MLPKALELIIKSASYWERKSTAIKVRGSALLIILRRGWDRAVDGTPLQKGVGYEPQVHATVHVY